MTTHTTLSPLNTSPQTLQALAPSVEPSTPFSASAAQSTNPMFSSSSSLVDTSNTASTEAQRAQVSPQTPISHSSSAELIGREMLDQQMSKMTKLDPPAEVMEDLSCIENDYMDPIMEQRMSFYGTEMSPELSASVTNLTGRLQQTISQVDSKKIEEQCRLKLAKTDNGDSSQSTQIGSLSSMYGNQDTYKTVADTAVNNLKGIISDTNTNFEKLLCSAIAHRDIAAKLCSKDTDSPDMQAANPFSTVRPLGFELTTPLGPVCTYDQDNKTFNFSRDKKYGDYLGGITQNLGLNKADYGKEQLNKSHTFFYNTKGGEKVELSTISYNTDKLCIAENQGDLASTVLYNFYGSHFHTSGLMDSQTSPISFPKIYEELEVEFSNFQKAKTSGDYDTAIDASQRITFLMAQAAFTQRGGSSIAEWVGASMLTSLFPDMPIEEAISVEKSVYQRGLASPSPEHCIEGMVADAKEKSAAYRP